MSETRDLKLQIGDPKPEIRISQPEPKTPNPKPLDRNPKSEASDSNPQPDSRNLKAETRNPKPPSYYASTGCNLQWTRNRKPQTMYHKIESRTQYSFFGLKPKPETN